MEVSSPRLFHDIPKISEPELEAIPNAACVSMKKRHSIAVSKPTRRNSVVNLNPNKRTRLGYTGNGSPCEFPISPKNTRTTITKYYSLPRTRRNKPSPNGVSRAIQQRESSSSLYSTKPSAKTMSRLSPYSLGSAHSFKEPGTVKDLNGKLTIRRCSIPENIDPLAINRFSVSSASLSSSSRSREDLQESLDLLSGSHDSVIDDMEWQMNASTNDISNVLVYLLFSKNFIRLFSVFVFNSIFPFITSQTCTWKIESSFKFFLGALFFR